ncbi:hypothetical protein Ancab_014798 [Ancistrocladus abbreviatus]
MVVEEDNNFKAEAASVQAHVGELPKDVAEEKNVIPPPDEKVSPSDEKARVPVPAAPAVEKHSGGSIERDAMLAQVEQEKKLALIKAWEDSEKTKADNKVYKKFTSIESWESTKKAYVEAQLRKMEEKLEKQKAEYTEKMKNKMAEIHKMAEEKRAMVEARRREDNLKVEEEAAKYRATGNAPKKFMGCCG